MNRINEIEAKLRILWEGSIKTYAIIVSEDFYSDIYDENEIPRSETLEKRFSLPVIITNKIKGFLIAI